MMELCFRSSVNSWECDENDHLNVRFYVEKHWQTLCGAVQILKITPTLKPDDLQSSLKVQHIRYLREARMAAPLSGYAGVVAADAHSVDIVTELRHSQTGLVVSTCIHRLRDVTASVTTQMSDEASPRGLADADSPYSVLPRSECEQYGFEVIGMGVVLSDVCGGHGQLMVHHYMGRLSDAMPHLWGKLNDKMEEDGEGGAVLEYRLRYHAPLQEADRYAVCSGISAVSAKVQQFTHLLFNAGTGQLCVSAGAVGVRLDLQARKAKSLSAQRQTQMQQHILRSLDAAER